MWIGNISGAITFAGIAICWVGCGPNSLQQAKQVFSAEEIAHGTQLIKTYCNTCHGVGDREMDAMLAPPLLGVRDAYLERHPEADAFVSAMVAFTRHPKRQNSLMPYALDVYGLKGSVSLSETDLRLTAIAVFAEQVERPTWMRDYRKQHPGTPANESR
ncbi:MAG: c-type cytochrome [Coraliomargarita sp.]